MSFIDEHQAIDHTLIKLIFAAYTTIIKATDYSHSQSLKELLEWGGAKGPCTADYGSSAYKFIQILDFLKHGVKYTLENKIIYICRVV